MQKGRERRVSRVLISTALGPGGGGIFPYTLLPSYRRLIRAVKDTGTTVIAKSATRYRRQGNFIAANPLTWRYIRRISGQGMLNAYGLTNQGVRICAREIKQSCNAGIQVVPNYYPEFSKGTETAIRELLESIGIYKEVMGSEFWALELNFSCPNAREAITENVNQGIACVRRVRRDFPELFLIAKVSIVHPFEFSEELEKLGVKAIHGVNTIPYNLVFPENRFPPSPLADVGGGGVSGGPACSAAKKYNADLRKKVTVFLIMGCGITKLEDIEEYFDLGADAVSFCTLALRRPGEAAKILKLLTS
jgi:dihydroorotate dehydrogenase (NAD+) catalytic subunit